MTLQILLFALGGAVLGFVADRLSSRWPSHRRRPDDPAEADTTVQLSDVTPVPTVDRTASPEGTLTVDLAASGEGEPRPRGIDWRTPVMVVVGALAFGALAARWTEPRDLLIIGAWFVALTVLFATDLDQRILPDVVTLPMIPIALLLVLTNVDPLLQGKELAVGSALAAGIGAPIVLVGTSLVLRGGIGMGDLKLAVSLGLLSGISRLFFGFLLASAASSVLLVALLGTRRLSLKSAIPFGPVLIGAGFVAALLPA